MSDAGPWSDLGARLASAAVLTLVGVGALWLGGDWLTALAILCTAILIWELARLCGASGGVAVLLGLVAAAAFYMVSRFSPATELPWQIIVLLFVVFIGIAAVQKHRMLWLLYAPVILIGAYAVVTLRGAGLAVVLWLVAVVVASDVAGYFAGRRLGGPKFWPRVSPSKTWSGTVAGWIAAGLVGFGFWIWAGGAGFFLWQSPLLAFAGQLGDIAESAVKRRAGVKDSSALIPGHGGLMDRLDALLGAALALYLASLIARRLLSA